MENNQIKLGDWKAKCIFVPTGAILKVSEKSECNYTRIGNMVNLNMYILYDNVSEAGYIEIAGLPYTMRKSFNDYRNFFTTGVLESQKLFYTHPIKANNVQCIVGTFTYYTLDSIV